ncbi:MAG TPA: UDP-N-acetylmuramoyl-tripeptide--D-alanyl-D-alanine ligase [Polyangiaceae bacterium]|nr:UDP-N-acetylmuramoyl-tripeptide--D-alanyl-D-alanine ligase [Polyangiaceae bacterium]
MASLIPQNSAAFSLSQVATLCAGRVLGADAECVGVSTDTRADLRGQLFVALRGERFDGHDFAQQALERGAAGVLVERELPRLGAGVVVSSTLTALGCLAAAHRQRWAKRIVGVAGSAGKTTTRSAISALLSELNPGAVHFASGNLNNLIGVPLVLLGLRPEHSIGVVEIGTNEPGEVRTLSTMAAPDLAVLTLIGIEHSEGLGDLDGIEREEGEIWSGLVAEGLAVANADDPRVQRTLQTINHTRSLSYGYAEGANYRLRSRTASALGGSQLEIERRTSFAQDAIRLETPLLGEAGAYATLAALAVGEWLGQAALEPARVSRALSAAGEPGRLTPIELADGTVVLDDSYNSNPASVKSSLATAREIARARAARLVLVIGEMRELGALAAEQHAEVGGWLAESGGALLVAVMGDAERFLEPAKRAGLDAHFAADAEQALELLLSRLQPKDVVLVKASRGVGAERLVRGLCDAKGHAA